MAARTLPRSGCANASGEQARLAHTTNRRGNASPEVAPGQEASIPDEDPSELRGGSLPDERATLVQWDDRYSTGNAVVDAQHKRLFALAAEVQTAVREQRFKQVQADALDALILYCFEHFAEEERLMSENDYPGALEHKRQHDVLAARAAVIAKAFKQGNVLGGETFPEFLSRWLRRHIGEEDVRLVRFLQVQRGEGAGSTW
jgi:hemerythrin-like metal-binding protein